MQILHLGCFFFLKRDRSSLRVRKKANTAAALYSLGIRFFIFSYKAPRRLAK